MDLCELAELAALVASHGPGLVTEGRPLSPTGMGQYWSASKCRFDRWAAALKEYRDHAAYPHQPGMFQSTAFQTFSDIRPVIEEILVGEMLTRVWTAVTRACDLSTGDRESEPIAQSVLLSQLEARKRALQLMVHGPGVEAPAAVALNQLRRRTQRWTDLLVGYLAACHPKMGADVSQLAADPLRARDFASDLIHEQQQGVAQQGWQVTLAALRAAFQHDLNRPVANVELTDQIGQAVLACFPGIILHSTGLARSLWLTRMQMTATDAQALIDELLWADEPLPTR
ncbi:MAG: hypothetical protein IIA67_06305 [Planctomycetes bacterium]|nr:hypothetical protein [Planctomycetota bacterium]